MRASVAVAYTNRAVQAREPTVAMTVAMARAGANNRRIEYYHKYS